MGNKVKQSHKLNFAGKILLNILLPLIVCLIYVCLYKIVEAVPYEERWIPLFYLQLFYIVFYLFMIQVGFAIAFAFLNFFVAKK